MARVFYKSRRCGAHQMRLTEIRIENFRCFENVSIPMAAYNAFVGPNGVGKSAVLSALNIFFGEATKAVPDPAKIPLDCFYGRSPEKPIRITLQFEDLTKEETEALSEYVRANKLIVCCEATYDSGLGYAEVHQYGIRSGIALLKPFFEKLKERAKIDDLKESLLEASDKLPDFPDLPAKKDDIVECVRAYERAHEDLHEEIKSRDQFYGFTRGTHKLRPFLNYIYIPAVKDASEEQNEARNTALGDLISRLVRNDNNFEDQLLEIERETAERYEKLLATNKHTLAKVSERLTTSMKAFFPGVSGIDLNWSGVDGKGFKILSPTADVRILDNHYEGPVSQFGHGIQRSYLMSVLSLLAEVANDGNNALLIIGCEEPELYQHPPQARHLARVLLRLCEGSNQVLLTTHSPYFVSGEVFENVRIVRRENGRSAIKSLSYKQYGEIIASKKFEKPHEDLSVLTSLSQKLDSSLSEIYFSRFVVLVEGPEDIGLLTAALDHEKLLDEFYALGGNIVPTNGKPGMICPLTICRGLSIPAFCIFDRDGKLRNEDNNQILLNLCEADLTKFEEGQDFFGESVIAWQKNIQSSIESGLGGGIWNNALSEVGNRLGPCATKAGKNAFALNLALNLIASSDKWPIPLTRAANAIIAFARGLP